MLQSTDRPFFPRLHAAWWGFEMGAFLSLRIGVLGEGTKGWGTISRGEARRFRFLWNLSRGIGTLCFVLICLQLHAVSLQNDSPIPTGFSAFFGTVRVLFCLKSIG